MDEKTETVAAWIAERYKDTGPRPVPYQEAVACLREKVRIADDELNEIVNKLLRYEFPRGLHLIARNEWHAGMGGIWIHEEAPVAWAAYQKEKYGALCRDCNRKLEEVRAHYCPHCKKLTPIE